MILDNSLLLNPIDAGVLEPLVRADKPFPYSLCSEVKDGLHLPQKVSQVLS